MEGAWHTGLTETYILLKAKCLSSLSFSFLVQKVGITTTYLTGLLWKIPRKDVRERTSQTEKFSRNINYYPLILHPLPNRAPWTKQTVIKRRTVCQSYVLTWPYKVSSCVCLGLVCIPFAQWFIHSLVPSVFPEYLLCRSQQLSFSACAWHSKENQ